MLSMSRRVRRPTRWNLQLQASRKAINDEGNLTIAIENKQEHKHEDKHHHYLRREFSSTPLWMLSVFCFYCSSIIMIFNLLN